MLCRLGQKQDTLLSNVDRLTHLLSQRLGEWSHFVLILKGKISFVLQRKSLILICKLRTFSVFLMQRSDESHCLFF